MKKKILLFFIFSFSSLIVSQNQSLSFSEAKALFDKGDYSRAYNIFYSISSSEEINADLASTSKYYSAVCLHNLGQVEASISNYEDFLSRYKFSTFRDRALFQLGSIYFDSERFSKARAKLLELTDEYDASIYRGRSLYLIGKSYFSEGSFYEAEEFLKQAVTERAYNSNIEFVIYTLGNLYEQTDRYSDAVTYYDELLSFYRDTELGPYAQLRIGVSYFKLNEYDQAILELSDPLIKELPVKLRDEANYILANSFFRLKEYENAANTYKKLLNSNEKESVYREVEYGLAWISFQLKEYEEAYKLFNKLSRTSNDSITVNSFYWSAECLRYLNRIDEATNVYKEFIEEYPDERLASSVFFKLGIIEFDKRRFDRAENYLNNALQSEDLITVAKAYSLLGEIKLKNEDYSDAEEAFGYAVNNAVLIDEVAKNAILGLGISQYYLGKYDEALDNFGDILSRYPNFESDKVNFYLAESFFAIKNYNNAIKHYFRISDADTELKKLALYGRAYSYFNDKDFLNSAYYFKEFINNFRNNSKVNDAKLRLADSYYGSKEFDKAGEIYGELFGRSNRNITNDFAYYQFAQSLYKSGRLNEAINEFGNLQKKFTSSRFADDSQYLIGWIHFQRNEFNEAIKNYKEIFIRYNRSSLWPISVYSIGDSYYNMGNYDSALVHYHQLLEEYPDTRYVLDAINGIQYSYLALDLPDNAVAVIDQYMTNNPASKFGEEILFKKGEIYYSLGSYKRAEESYTEFLELYPRSKLVAEAYYWIGKSLEAEQDYENAIENFNFVTTNFLSSRYGVDAIVEQVDLYVKTEQYDKATDLFNRTLPNLKNNERLAEIKFKKALVQIEVDDLAGAYNTFYEIINYDDGTLFADKAKIELSLLEIARSEYSNAEGLLRELGQNRTDDIGAQAQYLFGIVLKEQDRIDDAISAFVRVRSIFSAHDLWYSKSLIALGDCYVIKRDRKNAREMYRAVIKRHSRDELGAEARKKLNSL